MLVKVREMTGRSQTLLGGGGVKTTENTKFIGLVRRFRKDDFAMVSQILYVCRRNRRGGISAIIKTFPADRLRTLRKNVVQTGSVQQTR